MKSILRLKNEATDCIKICSFFYVNQNLRYIVHIVIGFTLVFNMVEKFFYLNDLPNHLCEI